MNIKFDQKKRFFRSIININENELIFFGGWGDGKIERFLIK